MISVESIYTRYCFVLQLLGEGDQVTCEQRIGESDFGLAIVCSQWDAFRAGTIDSLRTPVEQIRIEPSFAEDNRSTPAATGFSVILRLRDGREHTRPFDVRYFASIFKRRRAEQLREHPTAEKQTWYYRLTAFLDETEPVPRAAAIPISLGPATNNLTLTEGCREDLGPTEPWDQPDCEDLPVLIDHEVLDEAVAEARRRSDVEVAGFLLGHVVRDPTHREVFVVVTGLASSSATTDATAASVTYTPASFTEARNLIKLRDRGESVVGWFHSHPFTFCKECPLPTPRECIDKVLFYSGDDIHLMETTFDQPYMIGLLVAVEPRIESAVGHLPVKLYGWRDGQIQPRGFEVASTAACQSLITSIPTNTISTVRGHR